MGEVGEWAGGFIEDGQWAGERRICLRNIRLPYELRDGNLYAADKQALFHLYGCMCNIRPRGLREKLLSVIGPESQIEACRDDAMERIGGICFCFYNIMQYNTI